MAHTVYSSKDFLKLPKSLFIELKLLKIPVSGLMDEIPFVLVSPMIIGPNKAEQNKIQCIGISAICISW